MTNGGVIVIRATRNEHAVAHSRFAMELKDLKRIGPKIEARLAEAGITEIQDLLSIVPRRYEDRRRLTPIAEARPDGSYTIIGEVVGSQGGWRPGRGRGAFASVVLKDETGSIKAFFFGTPAKGVKTQFIKGRRVRMHGEVRLVKENPVMQHPDFTFIDEMGEAEPAGIVPIYPLIGGFGQKQISAFIKSALDAVAERLTDAYPLEGYVKHIFPSLARSLHSIHLPLPDDDIDALNGFDSPAHRRMIFDELFFLQLGLLSKRSSDEHSSSYPINPMSDLDRIIRGQLGFRLTSDQEAVLSAIQSDLCRQRPMHRLLQGDVGSGKTAVALLACATAIENGYQAALMAPTEILAEQHFRKLSPICEKAGIRARLLTAGLSAGDAAEIIRETREGRAQFLIGTHALISTRLQFRNLALIVIDEQHRFGVAQRARLSDKQVVPHVLVMSATPIPRTLALTVFGDLDLSVIRHRPPGRAPVETVWVNQSEKAYQLVRERLAAGERAFIVYPLVDESDSVPASAAVPMFEKLAKDEFSGHRLGLVHGRMGEVEKQTVMTDFAAGRIDILVATTIIEVGVDVPEAGVILIADAERFGLTQLHQLRGRVGRSDRRGLCILLSEEEIGETARRRLETMVLTDDGFIVAEKDLEIRGPGDILGTRQHGLPCLRWARLARDVPILEEAREAAARLLTADPSLDRHEKVKRILHRRWEKYLKFGGIG